MRGRGQFCHRRFFLRQRFVRGRGRPRYVSFFGGCGQFGHGGFFVRQRFVRGQECPRHTRLFGGRGRPPSTRLLRGRGRPRDTVGVFEVGGGPGVVAEDPFRDAEQI